MMKKIKKKHFHSLKLLLKGTTTTKIKTRYYFELLEFCDSFQSSVMQFAINSVYRQFLVKILLNSK